MTEILSEVVGSFLLAVLVNIVCTRFRLPVIVGFLLTGVISGPTQLGLVSDSAVIDSCAELGVAMLMFTIGMELSGEVLHRLKRPVFLGGSLQIGLMVAASAAALWAFQGRVEQGVLWGCLLALSSSAIVLQIFQQKGITATPVGRLSLAILVFQDIMVAPMMILVPLLAGAMQFSPASVAMALAKVAAMGAVMYVFARFVLDRLMLAVVRTRSSEILLLTTLCMCLGFATVTEALGMSFSLGAFLAGLMLARSRFAMSAVSDIMPYRDVFLSLFFITVGMMLDVRYVAGHIGLILLVAAAYIVGKTLLTMPAVLVQGYPLRTAIRTSLALSQVGEFSFVLAAAGLQAGMLSPESHQFFLALSVITMMLTPLLINVAPGLSKSICTLLHQPTRAPEAEASASSLKDHIIIVGFGFTGKQLAKAARSLHLRYTVLEMNPETVRNFASREPISYGDASQPVILESQGVEHARVLAIAISDTNAVRGIVANARKANPDLTIIARTRFVTEIERLYGLGANHVVAEEFEAGVETFSQVLTAYLLPSQDVTRMAGRLRREYYSTARRRAHTADLGSFVNRMPDLGVCAIQLEEHSPFAGKSLLEGNIRRRLGLTIVAVSRGGQLTTSPDAGFVIQPGDILYVFTRVDDVYTARERLNAPARVIDADDGMEAAPDPKDGTGGQAREKR